MQQATGPKFLDAVSKDFSRVSGDEISHGMNWKLALGSSGTVFSFRSRELTRQPADKRALTVAEPMKPEPPVIRTCVPARLSERSMTEDETRRGVC